MTTTDKIIMNYINCCKLYKYEEKHNIPKNERLTSWFYDYEAPEPKYNVSFDQITNKVKELELKGEIKL